MQVGLAGLGASVDVLHEFSFKHCSAYSLSIASRGRAWNFRGQMWRPSKWLQRSAAHSSCCRSVSARAAQCPAAPLQEDAANAFIQEHLVPQLVAANVTTVVDILRKPTADSHPGEARAPALPARLAGGQEAIRASASLCFLQAQQRKREASTIVCR